MAFLVFRNLLRVLGVIFVAVSWAAPPLDLTDPNALPEKSPTPKTLSEKDIVFVEDTAKDGAQASVMGIDVLGRAQPTRNGKPLAKLLKGETVRLLQVSKDGRWQAVHHLKSNKRCWVPKSAVRAPLSKVQENK